MLKRKARLLETVLQEKVSPERSEKIEKILRAHEQDIFDFMLEVCM